MIASDRVYLGLLAGAPIVLGAVILAIPAHVRPGAGATPGVALPASGGEPER